MNAAIRTPREGPPRPMLHAARIPVRFARAALSIGLLGAFAVPFSASAGDPPLASEIEVLVESLGRLRANPASLEALRAQKGDSENESSPARVRTLEAIIRSLELLPAEESKGNSSRAFFAERVAPILAANCAQCHGPEKQKGDLRLDSVEAALRGNTAGSVVAGGEASILARAIRYEGDTKMPPKGRLPGAEIEAILEWIRMAADDSDAAPAAPETAKPIALGTSPEEREKQWAFAPLARPPVPEVKNPAWPRGPIDSFILAKLEGAGLEPSPPAAPGELVRRLSFDLTGLPPAIDEIRAFEADPSDPAYAALAERYLASPRYGERWGRHWLDVARFAETNGFETNTPRPNAWPYRDYVIRAFNEDRPFPQFVADQLAGDSTGEIAATGFLVAGPRDEVESPEVSLTRQQRMDVLHDMIATTGNAFLGLTVGCARCHNHKFDPISQNEYYALQAIFSGVRHGEQEIRPPDYDARLLRAAGLKWRTAQIDAQLLPFEPLADPLVRIDPVLAFELASDVAARPPVHPAMNVERFASVRARYVRLTIERTNSHEPCIDELEIFTAGPGPRRNLALASNGARISASGTYPGSDIHRLEHINDGKYGNSRSWVSGEQGKGWVQIELAEPSEIDRVVWARDRNGEFKDRLALEYRLEVALSPDHWRLVASSDDRLPHIEGSKRPRLYSAAGRPPGEAEDLMVLSIARAELSSRRRDLTDMPKIYAGKFGEPEKVNRLHRGDPMQPREEIGPGALAAAGWNLDLPPDAPELDRRLALARWIADEKNPLPARVMANRVWHYHFGQGLVATPSDFGANGSRPTHPELLDWLASEFIAGGWSLKNLHRAVVLSNTYRQSSRARDDAMAADGGARLLWRFPPRRLEAESIRDAILWTSGNLDLAMGGPGFEGFKPNDNYVRVYDPKHEFGPAEWRRMIYQAKARTEPDPTFGIFDCPDASQATARRPTSTTPLQALNLLNSPFILQQAAIFAERLAREAGEAPAAQARRAFELALAREPDAAELEAAERTIVSAGLPAFCRAIFNASEFVYP